MTNNRTSFDTSVYYNDGVILYKYYHYHYHDHHHCQCYHHYYYINQLILNELHNSMIQKETHHSPAAVAVRGLLMLAILITVLLEHNTLFSTSAKPNPSLHTVFPSMLTATQTPGEPVSSFIHLTMDRDCSIADCKVQGEQLLFVSSTF